MTQIRCDSLLNPPLGCLQYHWGETREIMTYLSRVTSNVIMCNVQDGMAASNHSIMTLQVHMTTYSHKIIKFVSGKQKEKTS